jgi:hypothetical protein
MIKRRRSPSLFAISILSVAPLLAALNGPVRIATGLLEGDAPKGSPVVAFKGIP